LELSDDGLPNALPEFLKDNCFPLLASVRQALSLRFANEELVILNKKTMSNHDAVKEYFRFNDEHPELRDSTFAPDFQDSFFR
jgi:hypothetical protein